MADTKISDLTAATTVDDADLVPIVQSATTKKATWSLVRGTTSKVSGSNFTTSSTSLVDVTGLSFSAAANSVYEVDCCLKLNGADANGLKFTIAYSAAGASGYFTSISTAFTGNLLGTAGNAVCADANDHVAFIKAEVTTGANTGNITVKVLKQTSGTATVYIGSRMTVTLLA